MRLTGILILDIILTVLYALVVMILFNLANIYYLRKQVINKWIMLAVAVILFGGALALLYFYPNGHWHLIPLTLSLFAFLWFIDLRRRNIVIAKKAEKQVVIKPKPKPNRAKQLSKANESENGKSADKSTGKK